MLSMMHQLSKQKIVGVYTYCTPFATWDVTQLQPS